MYAVGIDLGTTNSAVAVLKGRPVVVEDSVGNRTLPSAVGWDPDFDQLVVGSAAKDSPVLYNTVLSIKRLMGTKEEVRIGPHRWLPEKVSAEILKALKKQVEERTGEEVTDAIITVPAYFQLAQKAATKEAGKLAGLNVQQLLEEPTAAVMAYGPRDDERILVYDLGGGTFDVTVIDYFAGALTTKAVFGNNHLGGDDFDNRLVQHFCELIQKEHKIKIDLDHDKEAWAVLRKAAEKAKIELSKAPGTRIDIPKVTVSQGRPIGLQLALKVDDFNAMIRDLVDGTLAEVEKALKHAKLDKSDINTVLLVGGSTYMPLVQTTVKNFFKKDPCKKVNPDLAVAMGAAACLLLDEAPESGRHVVTVGHVPEKTPEETLEVRGRTTPGSKIRITGGADNVGCTADDDGEYSVDVPLKKGINQLHITATSPDGQSTSLDPEPIILDPAAEQPVEPPAPAAPRLNRALSVSCLLNLGPPKIIEDAATVIIEGQTDLPREAASDQFGTAIDNQQELLVHVLEGDLPIGSLNTKLAEVHLKLPPGVPAGERVRVTFTVDENSMLTAEVELPGINRRGSVIVDLKSTADQIHIFEQVDRFLIKAGNKVRPEEKASLEQYRVALEDIGQQFHRLKTQQVDVDQLWAKHISFKEAAERLRTRLNDLNKKYA